MIIYNNCQHTEHFMLQHLVTKYWSHINVEEIDMAQLSTKHLRCDIE